MALMKMPSTEACLSALFGHVKGKSLAFTFAESKNDRVVVFQHDHFEISDGPT